MKKIIFVLLLPLMFSCGDIKENPEYKKLQLQRDSLAGLASTDAGTINKYLADFNDIQDNLNKIKEAEKLVTATVTTQEQAVSQKDQITSDMQMIYDLMEKNKKTINDLRRKLKKSDARILELEKMMDNLQKQMELKDGEINDLKAKLEQMNIKVTILKGNIDSLQNENKTKETTIAGKTEELNTAWYVFGTKKELIENGVISKEGGLLGIGKTAKLKDEFNKQYFTKVNITKLTTIPLNVKKATLITSHPSSSYKLDGSAKHIDKLVITNYNEFWSASKYLVIVVEQ